MENTITSVLWPPNYEVTLLPKQKGKKVQNDVYINDLVRCLCKNPSLVYSNAGVSLSKCELVK